MKKIEELTKEELIKFYEDKIKNVKTDYENKLINVQTNYEDKLKNIKDKLETEKSKYEQKLKNTKDLYEGKIRLLQEELEKHINKYEKLKNEYDLSAYNKYCKKTEQTEILISDGVSLEEETINEVEATLEKEEKIKKSRKKRKSPTEQFIKVLKDLKVKTEVKDYDFEKNGVDRSKVKEFGVDESYKVKADFKFEVIKIERPKYKDKNHIYQAVNEDPFPHSILTSSLAASIINFKYRLQLPLYRYKDMLNISGIKVSEANLCNYIKRAGILLEPLYEYFKEEIIKSKVIHIDETTLEVLDVKDKSKCYMFVYQTGHFTMNQVCLYEFNESRKTDKVNSLLETYKGYVVCDGYNGYDNLKEKNIKIQRCWVHIRRYFVDCYKILNAKEKSKHPAYKIVESINKLFKEEKIFKENKYGKEKIKENRKTEKYQKILKKIDKLIEEENKKEKISENLSKAINYYLNIKNKGELYTFVEDGEIEVDNNSAERIIKPFVIGRKNFLFCKTVDGANITSMLYTIVQTALKNGLEPEEYIKYCIENIEKVKVQELLPWNEKIQKKFNIKSIKNKNPGNPEIKTA